MWSNAGYTLRKTVIMLLTLPAVSFLVACFTFTVPAFAAQTVPYKLNFQGRLTGSTGAVLAGTYDMQFKFYTAATSGTYIWGETRTAANANAVTVTNGLFSILIGEGTAVAGSSASLQAAIAANQTMYLEVTVGAETLSPRNQMGASAYAINADLLDGLDSSAFAPASGSTNYAPMSGSTNYAPISGSGNYIQSGLSAQTANFNITGNGTVTGNFTNSSGTTLFQPANGSQTAFSIQTMASAVLFAADTSNSRIYIGNPVDDANAVLFVLDNKSGSGDPAGGVNGAEYYNSTNNKFRCYEAGVWKNCSNGTLSTLTTTPGAIAATAAKATNATILVTPLYIPGRITVNQLRVRVTTALGAAGDVGIYNAAGTLVINGGSSSLTIGTGVKTITPTQAAVNRILEPGQYYTAVTWNSTTGIISGINMGTGNTLYDSAGTLSSGGGLVLPSSITPANIVDGIYLYTVSINT